MVGVDFCFVLLPVVQSLCAVSDMSLICPGGGGTPLKEANGDVPLDGVAFSRLD